MSIEMIHNPHGGGAGGHFTPGGRVYRQGLVPWNSFGYIPPWNWGWGWPWWGSPYAYGVPAYTATPIFAPVAPSSPTVTSPCCYDTGTKALSCPGSALHGAPAAVRQRAQWQGRTIVLVNSPAFDEDRWLWEC